jgi:competence protein ComEA
MQFDKRWIAIGGAIVLLGAGLLLPRPAGPTRGATVSTDSTVPPQSATIAQATASPAPAEIAVYVCGAVKRPGVYSFAPGSRVVDALQQAGGPLPEADVEQINLAQPLSDAMKVMVPRKGQVLAADQYPALASSSNDGPSVGTHRRGRHSRGGSRGAHKLAPGQTLDVNTATADELVQLPGVGPSLAQRIVDYRQQYGPFQTIDDLQNVPGIGPSKFDRLSPFVRL